MKEARDLLVDDEQAFAKNLSRLLAVRGYQVSIANDGQSALRLFGEKEFDVAMLDLKMPGMDGLMTLEEIKNLGLFIETLILTGHGSPNSAIKAKELGAYSFLEKPCDLEDLLKAIGKVASKKNGAERRDGLDRLMGT